MNTQEHVRIHTDRMGWCCDNCGRWNSDEPCAGNPSHRQTTMWMHLIGQPDDLKELQLFDYRRARGPIKVERLNGHHIDEARLLLATMGLRMVDGIDRLFPVYQPEDWHCPVEQLPKAVSETVVEVVDISEPVNA